jgi:hypothetical protein
MPENVTARIEVVEIDNVRLVVKPWGWERWIADGSPTFPYALKEIFITAPYKSSVQVHRKKQETNYVQAGRGVLHYATEPLDVDALAEGKYSSGDLDRIVEGLKRRELLPGTVFHVFPGFVHRVEAIEDLTMVEASSTELDDVYRLRDDTSRGHGRIDSEHKAL